MNITPQELIRLSHLERFNIGNYSFLSQQPSILSAAVREIVVPRYLPQFVLIWHDIERATGFRWRCTSYLRDSITHARGQAFDLAPDIAKAARGSYAVFKGSDPVLYKRQPLITKLQRLKYNRYSPNNSIGIFVEPDHLHIQVLSNVDSPYPVTINKWGTAKPVYSDTLERMKLPITSTGYNIQ
jgi:hypothetical protein